MTRRFLSRRAFLHGLGLGTLSAAALGSYASAIEPLWRLRVTRYGLRPPGWTPGLSLRVAVLADLHACEPWMNAGRIAGIVARTNALRPDLTLLLGDYISSMDLTLGPLPIATWAPLLSELDAPLGIHAVLGNHDWWDDMDAQRSGAGPIEAHRALADLGVQVHHNRAVRLEWGGWPFWLAGLGDQIALKPDPRYGRGGYEGVDDLDGTLAQVTDDAPVLLMAHEPDIFPRVRAVSRPVALTLSGHTHGGQVRLFGHSPRVPSRYGNRYAYGHVSETRDGGGMADLLVSGGLGCSILPVRFGVPPEIVLLELG